MTANSSRWLGALLSACALVVCLPAQAQWKWRDTRGQIQYSDLPPPAGTPAKDILQRPYVAAPMVTQAASAASAPAAAASATDPTLEAKRKQAEQEDAAKRHADEARVAQQKAQNCDRARAYMRSLDSGQRIARTNDKGEREILDDAARAHEVEQTRQTMASECR
ncbi:DUF4124 domain-containing protein [Methylibium sp.]|uniref:DUF4124 domain-containing protein n=1 Tax=Methylibium sp. TaxID=2067992 RepID=UPI003D11093A